MANPQFPSAPAGSYSTGTRVSLNRDWDFHLVPESSERSASDDVPPQSWESVNVPHFGRLEPYDVSTHFQGICRYRRLVAYDEAFAGKRVTVEFEAAMQVADVWVNGEHVLTHEGGYLPFVVDVTDRLTPDAPCEILLRLDNRDQPNVPPGKPLRGMDFCYFTGLYRNVWLDIVDPVHVSHPNFAGKVAGGGIFVRYENVSEQSADVVIEVDVVNDSQTTEDVAVHAALSRASGGMAAEGNAATIVLTPGASHVFSLRLSVAEPALWSPNAPDLYTLNVSVAKDGRVCDEVARRIGIRTLHTDPATGFFVNGAPIQPFGANRHQAYPYVGNALSDNAQYRDAWELKAAGYDIIRLSHYPQSPAFLDACDELGLLAIICIPGWQYFNDTPQFRANVIRDMRETIRRDRNHACAVLWETSLNETNGFDDILHDLIVVAHEEYPGDQMLTCGDTEGHDPSLVEYDVPYSGWDGATRTRPNLAGKMSLHREYGDNQFGGYSRYTRGDGETLMLVQAWNFQTAVNDHLGLGYTWGQCTWEAFDNNRGFATEIATCGAMDLFRLPKFLYYFFQSQRDPSVSLPGVDAGPMVFIANYWRNDGNGLLPIVVFSNCEEIEMFLNGESLSRRTPDDGGYTPFGDTTGFDLNYWKAGESVPVDERNRDVKSPVFTGGNCRNLKHPPFTFDSIAFQPGELTAVGYIDGKAVARHVRRTPRSPAEISMQAQASGRPLSADGADIVFVHAAIVDENGTVVPDNDRSVHFALAGDAVLIGDNPATAEVGIATILVRAGTRSGPIELAASSDGLPSGRMTLSSSPS